MFVTVVIPTRNRPALFRQALESVLGQAFRDLEVIVVMDGSEPVHDAAYDAVLAAHPEVQRIRQPARPNGHGQSYSMNTGAYAGQGDYVAFLDDDDYWTDPEHLSRVHAAITASDTPVDACYANQRAFFADGSEQTRTVWVEDLAPDVADHGTPCGEGYVVPRDFLLGSKGFAHLNCSVIRRDLYLELAGMDENIRYECDRDIYLRTVDAAERILYFPQVVSRHHIPEKARKDNMSTLVSDYQKALYQMAVFEKNQLLARHDSVRELCRIGLAYVYKNLAEQLLRDGRRDAAVQYANKALALDGGLKWRARVALMRVGRRA